MDLFDPARLPDPNFKLPDFAPEFIGWRAWQVGATVPPFGVSPKLYSVTHCDFYWTPRRTSEAECTRKRKEQSTNPDDPNCIPHDPPCGCGFYSAKSWEHLRTMQYHLYDGERGMYVVIGRVANTGKVIEGSLGWRAQFSYPLELFVPYEIWKLAKPLAEGYGCAVRLDNFLKPGHAIA
jgi:hypothetical protein